MFKRRQGPFLHVPATFLTFLLAFAASAAPRPIYFWHSMGGSLGEKLQKIVDRFNKSQSDVNVVMIFKGNYTDSLNAVVAAYRGSKQPHITQVFEVGTQSMMKSGAIIPVEDVFTSQGETLNKKDFLAPIAGYYSLDDGKMMALPFNSSTPIMYYNADMMKELGITKVPETWQDMHALNKTIQTKSGHCGLIFGWQAWILVENFSAINNLAIANPANGFKGLDVKMNLTNPELAKNINAIADGIKGGSYCFEGRRSEAPMQGFLAGHSVFFLDSSSSIGTFKSIAKFKWGTAYQPYLADRKPQNSLIGGAALWVMKGHSNEDYKAVVAFLKYMTKPEVQMEWHQVTGYLPVSYTAYKLSKDSGFYAKDPDQETAVKQLLRGPVTENSRGIRLGNFSQVREVVEEYLEKIWASTLPTQKALEDADREANLVLKRFAELRSFEEPKP